MTHEEFKKSNGDLSPFGIETGPEWKVYYHGDFFCHQGREHPGKEVPTDVVFDWAGLTWHVPAVYPCTSGLVVDVCACTEPELFIQCEKRYLESHKSPEDVDWDNPLNRDTRVDACYNGETLQPRISIGIIWRPGEESPPESRWVLEHYGLDLDKAWFIYRFKFQWEKKNPLKSLSLTLKQQPVPIPADRFTVEQAGDTVTLRHPLNGTEYALTVVELEQGKVDAARFPDDDMEYPTCYMSMTYWLDPDLPVRAFQVQDCDHGDRARPKAETRCEKNGGASAGVVMMSHTGGNVLRGACSSLHFAPVEQVEWRASFLEKLVDDITIEIVKE